MANWERINGLPDTLDGDHLKSYPEAKPPTEETCREVIINQGRWTQNLPAEERDTVETYAAAIRSALSKETFDPTKLSIDSYIQQTEHPVVDILKDIDT
jgi:hypothetical protein